MDFTKGLKTIANKNIPTKTFMAHPFIKWAGGKRSIINKLIQRIPKQYSSYYEPFLGGGALFFALNSNNAFLSDINFYLIVTYTAIRDNLDDVIYNLKIHKKNHKIEYYQKAKIKIGKEQEQSKVAALFIYLNKTCYNGLYRVNKSGLFNVPMGKYSAPSILDEDNLRACSKFLQNAIIRQHNFIHCNPQKNQFYYLDPPYHETFSNYDGSGFKSKEHEKLADFCNNINDRHGFFMLSNSDTPFVRKLYKGYSIETISASRFISCKANERNKQNELIIRNY